MTTERMGGTKGTGQLDMTGESVYRGMGKDWGWESKAVVYGREEALPWMLYGHEKMGASEMHV